MERRKKPRLGQQWAIILAGGEGRRLSGAVRKWFGHDYPKQFCAFYGSKTMVEQTVERTRPVASLEHVLTIVGKDQIRFIPQGARLGRLIKQPKNRGTAAGILFSTAHVLKSDPYATVVILPSDHFITPSQEFSNLLRVAIQATDLRQERVILLAAHAEGPETDYGWIEASSPIHSSGLSPVSSFREKPVANEALALFMRGGLWNTMITVAKVSALWSLARKSLPNLTRRFDELLPSLGSKNEMSAINAMYQDIDSNDFSKEILEPNAKQVDALPLSGITWNDWGRPERIIETLARFNLPASWERTYESNRPLVGRSPRFASFT